MTNKAKEQSKKKKRSRKNKQGRKGKWNRGWRIKAGVQQNQGKAHCKGSNFRGIGGNPCSWKTQSKQEA